VANATHKFVYFIESGLASIVSEIHTTAAADIGIVGSEGMTGLGVATRRVVWGNRTKINWDDRNAHFSRRVGWADLYSTPMDDSRRLALMTRFYFDVLDDGVCREDTEGTALKDPEEAGVEATLALAEMALETLPGTKSQHLRMTVRDDRGGQCLYLQLAFKLTPVEK
jgi:hypothetical protein